MTSSAAGRPWWRTMFTDLEGGDAYDGDYWSVRSDFGARPALVVVDVIEGFTGKEGQTLAEAAASYPTACGPAAWQAVPVIRRVVDLADRAWWPVVYTTGLPGGGAFGGTVKGDRGRPVTSMDVPGAVRIPEAVEPPERALVLAKPKASAFFDTPLVSYLVRNAVDTVIVVGATTSGCVRATVVDSYSHGFSTFVVEDGCFDRSRLSHGVNLAEMDLKYADVVTSDELHALVTDDSRQADKA
ncbi:isochorismatase family protein [Streptomyces tuirus]|uniref:Isochorismatase family protein n=1 Tax=Streptomyces tuirus TaxID=68278 RepID=A0A941IZZ5_9ACTN|nr:isochorismatase family protein [Streptomyces tuirus]